MATNIKQSPSSTSPIVVAGLCLILGIVLGYLLSFLLKINKEIQPSTSPPPQQIDKDAAIKPFFSDHSAIVQGKIKSVTNKILTIEHVDGKTVDLTMNDQVYISEAGPPSSINTTPSTDIKKLELGKDALVNLKEVNNEFKIFSVTILPNMPAPKPLASPK